MAQTPAHSQIETFHLQYNYPSHEPRETDPHYHVFNNTKNRMEKAGLLKCWIGNADCQGAIELHHDAVEFALSEIVDVNHFMQLFPEYGIKDEDGFKDWIESEGNLLPLCTMHHRGLLGIHSVHYPAWRIQKFMKTGVAVPEKVIRAEGSTDIK